MADTAQTHANGVASDRTEWYGGATRFELELEVQRQSIHLLISHSRRYSTSSHDTWFADITASSSNPCRTHTTSTISASKSTSTTMPLSSGASTSSTSPNRNTSPISRMCDFLSCPCAKAYTCIVNLIDFPGTLAPR
jgi:hypothetical protein